MYGFLDYGMVSLILNIFIMYIVFQMRWHICEVFSPSSLDSFLGWYPPCLAIMFGSVEWVVSCMFPRLWLRCCK